MAAVQFLEPVKTSGAILAWVGLGWLKWFGLVGLVWLLLFGLGWAGALGLGHGEGRVLSHAAAPAVPSAAPSAPAATSEHTPASPPAPGLTRRMCQPCHGSSRTCSAAAVTDRSRPAWRCLRWRGRREQSVVIPLVVER